MIPIFLRWQIYMDDYGLAQCYSGNLEPIDCYNYMIEQFKGNEPWNNPSGGQARSEDENAIVAPPMPGMKPRTTGTGDDNGDEIENEAGDCEEEEEEPRDDDEFEFRLQLLNQSRTSGITVQRSISIYIKVASLI